MNINEIHRQFVQDKNVQNFRSKGTTRLLLGRQNIRSLPQSHAHTDTTHKSIPN